MAPKHYISPDVDDFFSSVTAFFHEVKDKGFDSKDDFKFTKRLMINFLVACKNSSVVKARASCPITLPDGTEPSISITRPPSWLKIDDKDQQRLEKSKSEGTFITALRSIIGRQSPSPPLVMADPLPRPKRPKTQGQKQRKRRIRERKETDDGGTTSDNPAQTELPTADHPRCDVVMESQSEEPSCFNGQMEMTGLGSHQRLQNKSFHGNVEASMSQSGDGIQELPDAMHSKMDIDTQGEAELAPQMGVASDMCVDVENKADGINEDEGMGETGLVDDTSATTKGHVAQDIDTGKDSDDSSPADTMKKIANLTQDIMSVSPSSWEKFKPRLAEHLGQLGIGHTAPCTTFEPEAAGSPLKRLEATLPSLGDEVARIPAEKWATYQKKMATFCASVEIRGMDFGQRLCKIGKIIYLSEEEAALASDDWDRAKSAVGLCALLAEVTGSEHEDSCEDAADRWVKSKLRDIVWLQKYVGAKARIGRLVASASQP